MNTIEKTQLDMELFVTEDDNSVYIKLNGFSTVEDAEEYAEHLAEYLPLMLFESEIIH